MAAGDMMLSMIITAQNRAAGVIAGIASSLGPVGIGLVALSAGAIAVGATVTKMAADFQQGTNLLITSAGETTQNIGMIRSGLLAMSVDTATSTSDLIAGMFNIESAGFHGAAALMIEKAAAQGAKVENANLAAITDVLTTSMHNYLLPASQAVDVMNSFRLSASIGKMRMDDLTGALQNALPIASQAGVKLTDVEAALSTMSLAGDKGAIAGTHLSQMFTSLLSPSSKATKNLTDVGLTTQQISNEMRVSLPGTIALITQAVGEKFPAGSAKYIAALSAISGGNKQMKAMLELSGGSLNTFIQDAAQLGPTMKANSTVVDGWSTVQQNLNLKMDAAKNALAALGIGLGTMLIPFVSSLFDAITPVITSFSAWVTSGHAVSDMLAFFKNNAQIIIPVLAGIGAILLAVLIPAVWTLAAGVIAATWQLLAIGAGVALLVAGFMLAYNHLTWFRTGINQLGAVMGQVWSAIQANFLPVMAKIWAILQQVGGYIITQFTPVWHQLVSLWQSQLMPMFAQLWGAIQKMTPLFQLLGAIIVIVVIAGLALLTAAISSTIKGIAGFLSGLVIVMQGVVQLFTGVMQVVGGIVGFICDLLTGHFDKLGSDLGMIWQGIINIFWGAWTVIAGIFLTAWFTVSGIVTGFIDGIIGFFVGLYNTLVGHSLVPDLVNGIVSWFASLPGRALGAVRSLAGQLIGFFGGLASQAVSWGVNLIQGFINGIGSMLGAVGNAAGNIMNTVKGFLGFHSPAAQGEGRYIVVWGAGLVAGFVQGMQNAQPLLNAQLSRMIQAPSQIASGGGSSRAGSAFAIASPSSGNSGGPQTMNLTITMDGRKITEAIGVRMAKEVRIQGNVHNR